MEGVVFVLPTYAAAAQTSDDLHVGAGRKRRGLREEGGGVSGGLRRRLNAKGAGLLTLALAQLSATRAGPVMSSTQYRTLATPGVYLLTTPTTDTCGGGGGTTTRKRVPDFQDDQRVHDVTPRLLAPSVAIKESKRTSFDLTCFSGLFGLFGV